MGERAFVEAGDLGLGDWRLAIGDRRTDEDRILDLLLSLKAAVLVLTLRPLW